MVEQEDPDISKVLETLDDQIVIDLFVQILKIIEFFCKGYAELEYERLKTPKKIIADKT